MQQEESYEPESAVDVMGGSVFKNLWAYISDHPSLMIFSMFLGVVGGILQLAPHFIVYLIATDIIADQISASHIYMLGFICLVLVVISFVSSGASSYISHVIAASVQKNLRQKIAEKLTRVPLGFFASRDSHDFKTMVVDDVEAVEDGVAHLIPETTAAFAAPLVILMLMVYMDWRMAIISVIGLFSAFYLMGVAAAKSTEITKEFYASKAKMGRLMTEIASILPMVKIFNQGDAAIGRTTQSFMEFNQLIAKWIGSNVNTTGWFMLLSSSALVFVLPFGLLFIYLEWLDLGTLIFFLLFSIGLNNLTINIYSLTHRIARQANIHTKMDEFFNAAELEVFEPIVPSGKYDIEFDEVSFTYERDEILSAISFKLEQGSSLALVGPSGAGKTTIARLLPRFWDVNKGAIKIGGVDIRHMSYRDLSAQMSFVFQEIFLFSDSIADNIKIGREDATEEEMIVAAKAAQIHDFIVSLPDGYATKLNAKVNLSGGQKQRLCIARAILKDAPILVLDEATAFADPENEAELQKAINHLIKGKTLIVIAHRLSTIKQLDNIAVIVNGKLAELGKHDELLAKRGRYNDMWQAHIRAKSFKIGTQKIVGDDK